MKTRRQGALAAHDIDIDAGVDVQLPTGLFPPPSMDATRNTVDMSDERHAVDRKEEPPAKIVSAQNPDEPYTQHPLEITNIEFMDSFHSTYQRNNKKKGRKHMRCFPGCTPGGHFGPF